MTVTTVLRDYLELVASVIVLTLIVYPFELLSPAEKGQRWWATRGFNLAYMVASLALTVAILQPIYGLIILAVTAKTGWAVPSWGDSKSGIVEQILFAFAFAIIWDLFQYFMHRLQHTNRWLWETHRFHHTETALNATTQARHHLLNQSLAVVFYLPVLMIFGPRMPHYIAVFVMFRVWGLINHANIRVDLGPFTTLIAGPQWHRIHHSKLSEHRDRNFATFFPFIDRLFGTYYRPKREEYPPCGLSEEEEVDLLREATIGPFVRLAAPPSEPPRSELTSNDETAA